VDAPESLNTKTPTICVDCFRNRQWHDWKA